MLLSDKSTSRGELRIHNDLILIFSTIAFVLAMHGQKIISFHVGIDGEFYSYDYENFARNWISQGRWAMGTMVAMLPPFSATPLIPPLLFCAGLSLSTLMLASLLTDSRKDAILFSGLFLGNPLWVFIGQFDTLSWGVGVCLVVLAWSLRQILAGKSLQAALGVAFAAGIYQSAFLFFLAALVPLCFPKTSFWRAPCAPVPWQRAVAVLVLAAIVNTVAGKVGLWLTDQQLSYVDGYVRLNRYRDPAQTKAVILHLLGYFESLSLRRDGPFLGWGWAVTLPVWVGVAFGAIDLIRKKEWGQVGHSLMGWAALAASVLFIPVLAAAEFPHRAQMMLPFIYALLGLNAFRSLRFAWAQWGVWGYALFVSFWIGISLYYADDIVRQRDLVMGSRVFARIEEVGRPVFGAEIPVALVGYWAYDSEGPARQIDTFGSSFFTHDQGNVFRVRNYLHLLGFKGFRGALLTELKSAGAAVEAMPSWPDADSVAIIDHVVVVKLGPPNERQKEELK